MQLVQGIPNLLPVVDGVYSNLWRGGQPTSQASWNYLKSIGIKTIIKLNTETGDPDIDPDFVVWHFPINTVQQIIGPVTSTLARAQANISSNTYFHCELGENRTGTLGIFYRVLTCGWPKAEAIKEAKLTNWAYSLPALQLAVAEL